MLTSLQESLQRVPAFKALQDAAVNSRQIAVQLNTQVKLFMELVAVSVWTLRLLTVLAVTICF